MTIINLTMHPASASQKEAGVQEPQDKGAVKALLLFRGIPSREEIGRRAQGLAALASGSEGAMIGGAPYLMGPLAAALKKMGIMPLFSFTERKSAEVTQPDGTTRKVSVFEHLGFVEG